MVPASAHMMLCPSTVVELVALASRTDALTHLQTFLLLAESSSFLLEPVVPHEETVLSLCIPTEESWDLPPAPPVFLHSRGVGLPVPQPLEVEGST